jgi:hypothetical protein
MLDRSSGTVLGSRDYLEEGAYLVARGVRALSLVGHCPTDQVTLLSAWTALSAFASDEAMPFVHDRGDGTADCGYAAAPWVIALYRWVVQQMDDPVGRQNSHRVIGLLLGYDVRAVTGFENNLAGRPFAPALTDSVLACPAST